MQKKPTPVVISTGCLPASVTVPLVIAALDVLTDAGFQLADFTDPHVWAGTGAYVEPRRATGEVILHHQIRGWNSEYTPRGMTSGEYEPLLRQEREERRTTLAAYAAEFRSKRWTVAEFHENRAGESVMERLIMSPPASLLLPPGR